MSKCSPSFPSLFCNKQEKRKTIIRRQSNCNIFHVCQARAHPLQTQTIHPSLKVIICVIIMFISGKMWNVDHYFQIYALSPWLGLVGVKTCVGSYLDKEQSKGRLNYIAGTTTSRALLQRSRKYSRGTGTGGSSTIILGHKDDKEEEEEEPTPADKQRGAIYSPGHRECTNRPGTVNNDFP